jgi:putative tryptophan/tyrosine transport system substrate-binding protein
VKRRAFIAFLGGAAATLPLVARAQQVAMPVVGFINSGAPDASARFVAAFRNGLNESGTIEGQNVMVEYHYLEGQFDRLPALMADLVRRQVAVIATPASLPACKPRSRPKPQQRQFPSSSASAQTRFGWALSPVSPILAAT